MKYCYVLFSMLFGLQVQARPESEALKLVQDALRNNQQECLVDSNSSQDRFYFQTLKFKSRHNDPGDNPYYTRYTKYGCKSGAKGSAVVSPGRTESSLKYLETAYDLIERGYSPVFVIDHRGQGLSPRLLENTNIGHVKYFSHYVDDFEDFMNQIVMGKNSKANKKKLYLLSNSMGGAISILYFQRMRENSPIRHALLFGPMIKINFDGVNLEDQRTESGVRLQTSLLCLSGLTIGGLSCDTYANPKWSDYDPNARSLDPQNPNPGNLTHSLTRFQARNFLWDEAYVRRDESRYSANEIWEGMALGGPSVRWTWQSTKYNQKMRKKKNLRKIKTPLTIVTGDKDIRADLEGHRKFCQDLKNVGGACEMTLLKNSFHEIMVESDFYRNQAMKIMFQKFEL